MASKNSDFKTLGSSQALINKVTNTIDGGLRITIDIPSTDIDLAKALLSLAVDSKEVFVNFMVKNHGR